MSCHWAINHLDQFLDAQLSNKEVAKLEAHCQSCVSCNNALTRARELKQALARLPVTGVSPGQFDRIMARVEAKQLATQKRQWFFAGVAATLLVASVLTVLVQLALPLTDSAPFSIGEVKLNVNERRVVSLVFRSPTAFPDAKLILKVPRHVELEGYQGIREVTLATELQAGVNRLKLPLFAGSTVAKGELTAVLEHQGAMKQFIVPIHVVNLSGAKLWIHHLPQV